MKNTLYIFILLLPLLTNAQTKETHLRNGNNLYEDSLFNDAEMKYRKSLEKDQDYFTASYNLADAIYKQERFKEASSLFEGLIDNAKTKDQKAKLHHNIGNSLFKQQKLKECIESYKYALKNNPKDEETRHNLALAQKMWQEQKKKQEEQKENQKEDSQDEKEENQEDPKQEKEKKQEKKQEQQQSQEKEDMSKEDAEKMLEALQQEEKKLQEEMQKKKVKGKNIKVLKDW